MRLSVALSLCLLVGPLVAQTSPDARFTSLLDNSQVAVYALALSGGQRAVIFQNTHEIFWISLDPGTLSFARDNGETTRVQLGAGDTRFFASFAARQVRNDGDIPTRGLLVEIKTHGLISQACDCLGRVEQALCGCAGAAPMPAMWAASLGRVTVGGTTLAAGEGFASRAPRGDTVLIALTPVQLSDAGAGAQPITLQPGQVAWIPRGRHQWKNTASTTARYITIEL